MKTEKSLISQNTRGVAKTAAIIVGAAAVGATLAYFLDPDSGKKRRAMVIDKSSEFSKGAIDMSVERWNGAGTIDHFGCTDGCGATKDNKVD